MKGLISTDTLKTGIGSALGAMNGETSFDDAQLVIINQFMGKMDADDLEDLSEALMAVGDALSSTGEAIQDGKLDQAELDAVQANLKSLAIKGVNVGSALLPGYVGIIRKLLRM